MDPDNWDFWPASGSPLIGAADAAYAPNKDFNGMSRQGPFDVGAYETESLMSNPGWPIQDSFKDSGSEEDVTPPLSPTGLNIKAL